MPADYAAAPAPKDRTPFAETEVFLEVLEGRQEDALDRLRAFTPTERREFLTALRRTEVLVKMAEEMDQ